MTSLEKQILKLNEKYIQRFISEIINIKDDITEEKLKKIWKDISSSSTKKSKKQNSRKSGYTIFLVEQRPMIASKNENLKSTEIISLIAKKWRDLSPEEKQVYTEKAKKQMNDNIESDKESDNDNCDCDYDNKYDILKEPDFSNMSIKELRNKAEKYGLFTAGKKQDIIKRLNDYKIIIESEKEDDDN